MSGGQSRAIQANYYTAHVRVARYTCNLKSLSATQANPSLTFVRARFALWKRHEENALHFGFTRQCFVLTMTTYTNAKTLLLCTLSCKEEVTNARCLPAAYGQSACVLSDTHKLRDVSAYRVSINSNPAQCY